MGSKKKDVKRVPIEKLLNDHFGKKVLRTVDKTSNSKSPDFMLITSQGFELYMATKKVSDNQEVLDIIKLIKSYSWENFKSVKIDKFAMSTRYEFDTGPILQVDASDDLTKSLQANNIEVTFLERKWFNKILGFRSKKKWKMIVASFCYLLFLAGAVDGFIQTDSEKAEIAVTQAKEDAEKAKLEADNKAKAEAKEAEKKKVAEEKAAQENKEKEEKAALMIAFELASKEMIEKSNGIIPNVTIEDTGSFFQVKVFVDEATWARSNESEKLSFSTTVGTSIENALSPHDTYVDILSATNHDVVASQKLFGGWKVKR